MVRSFDSHLYSAALSCLLLCSLSLSACGTGLHDGGLDGVYVRDRHLWRIGAWRHEQPADAQEDRRATAGCLQCVLPERYLPERRFPILLRRLP
jgi:hypothetical protein